MPSEKNLSFILQKANATSFEDRPEPKIEDPHGVIVRVKYTGVCGSDVHYWVEGKIGPYELKEPMVLGHESSGVVQSVGSEVTSLKVGDRVAMEPGVPCRLCAYCKAGKYNLCSDMAFAATPPTDGTLCKYYPMPEDFCYKLPENVSLEEGALVEPLSVAVHLVRQANVSPGQKVVVFGAGPVGLMCMAVAKYFGASKIVAIDINEERLKFAQSFAATGGFSSKKGESPADSASRLNKDADFGDGADVAIDATGVEICIQTAINVLRKGGTFVQGGMGKDEITFPILVMLAKELTVKGSFRYSAGDYKLAVEIISSGVTDFKKLITNKVTFKEAEQALKDTKEGKGIKTLIAAPED